MYIAYRICDNKRAGSLAPFSRHQRAWPLPFSTHPHFATRELSCCRPSTPLNPQAFDHVTVKSQTTRQPQYSPPRPESLQLFLRVQEYPGSILFLSCPAATRLNSLVSTPAPDRIRAPQHGLDGLQPDNWLVSSVCSLHVHASGEDLWIPLYICVVVRALLCVICANVDGNLPPN